MLGRAAPGGRETGLESAYTYVALGIAIATCWQQIIAYGVYRSLCKPLAAACEQMLARTPKIGW